MSELDKQQGLCNLLNDKFCELNLPSKAYCKNEFKRIDGNALNRPDLIITNAPKIKHPILLDPEIMKPIIGIELKDETRTTNIIDGLEQTKKYYDYNYFLREKDYHFRLSSLAFTTTTAVREGIIHDKFENNKLIERFSWKQRIAILINYDGELCWSFRNYYFRLDGKKIGRFGEHATFIKY
jgi:hypothetical protein